MIDLGRYGRTLTVLHATEIPDDEPLDPVDADEDEDDGGLTPDGKRYRYT